MGMVRQNCYAKRSNVLWWHRLLDRKSHSSSGGMANVIAKWIINNGGFVYGCAIENIEELFFPKTYTSAGRKGPWRITMVKICTK